MTYLTDFGMMKITHEIAETYSRLLHRADDDESAEVQRRVGELLTEAKDLLEKRWAWSVKNPPAILRERTRDETL